MPRMSDNMACTHRAALKRCHELLQEAHAYVPENEAWHDQVTEILLPCDEAMECPTVPSAPAPQPWTEGELARAITDEKAIAIARQHPETLPSLFAWRTDDEEDLSKHHFTAQDLAADLLDARAEIASLRAKLDKVCEAAEEAHGYGVVSNPQFPKLQAAIAAARAGGGE